MKYAWVYACLSIIIGAADTVRLLLLKDYEKIIMTREKFLEEFIRKGDVEETKRGEHTIYFGKTPYGRAAVNSSGKIDSLQKNYPVLFLLILFFIGTLSTAVTWPFKLFSEWEK